MSERGSRIPQVLPPVVVPAPAPPDTPQLFYRRGKRWPRAIAWFGFKSFWGHLWHMAASVIATEDIDCRDWMHPDDPDVLTRRLADTLNAPSPDAPTLTEALEGDLWIDFVADTGDDFSVSQAVARLIAGRYEVDDPDDPSKRLLLPRGHVLLFGGDTAYPVATDIEIHNRVLVPFNEVLRENDDNVPRALLGIPGNHDWYAGLDGFGRMFRARQRGLDLSRLKSVPKLPDEEEPPPEVGEVDRLGQIGHFIDWVEAFRVGTLVIKRAALALVGYRPVQSASYWSLRVAPNLDFWGVDRQLRHVDFHQRGFFSEQREAKRGVVLCLADPVYAMLEPNPAGTRALAALGLSIGDDGLLVLTGDTHHYCRQTVGRGLHVIAGGGGAFLHPQRVARRGFPASDAEFPGPKTSLVLALQVPWQIAHGRSGFLVHTCIAIACAPLFGVQWSTGTGAPLTSILTAIVATLACFFLGGFRSRLLEVLSLSLVAGGVIGFMPLAVFELVRWVAPHAGLVVAPVTLAGLAYALSIYVGTLTVGTYLMLLTILGIEQHQAFSALAHPGYKHFVRLRFHRDGRRVDGWVLGRVDPLSDSDQVVLVDRFTWTNPVLSPQSSVLGGEGSSSG